MNFRTAAVFVLAILICFVADFAASEEYCEGPSSSPKWHKFQGNCYLLSLEKKEHRQSYFDAEDYCRAQGSHLVSIHSEEENQFIIDTVKARYRYVRRIWIGLSSLQKSDDLQWSDDTAVTYQNIIPKTQYKKESCFIIYLENGGRGWRREHCALHYAPICKRPSGDVTPTAIPPLTTPTVQGNCPSDWIKFGQRCFKYFGASEGERKTFKEAKEACMSLGEDHDLASIHSMDEQAFLAQKAAKFDIPLWIGFRYVENDEIGHDIIFGWTDNSRTDFTYWAPGHPPRGTWKYCAHLDTTGFYAGTWTADYCDLKKYGYICQGTPSASIPDTTPEPSACDPNFVAYKESCYRYFPEPQSWYEAEATCEKQGGHLVSISDRYEEFFLHGLLKQASGQVWIGLKTLQDTRIVHWSDKQPVYYANWGARQPYFSNLQTSSCISTSTVDGMQWNTTDCAAEKAFVCEITKDAPEPLPVDVIGSCPLTHSSWIDIGDRYCYHVATGSQETSRWGDSSRYCMSQGMKMISFHSRYQMKTLMPYLWKSYKNVWLGLIRSLYQETFLWVDESPLDFTNWAEGEPSRDSDKHCVSLSTKDATWSLAKCDDWARNVCKVKKHLTNGRNVRSIVPDGKYGEAAAAKAASSVNEKTVPNGGGGTVLTALVACVGLTVLLVASVFYYMRRKEDREQNEFPRIPRAEKQAADSRNDVEKTLPKY